MKTFRAPAILWVALLGVPSTPAQQASKELGSFEHPSAVMQETRFTINALKPKSEYGHRLMGYNNDPSTSLADIKRVIRITEDQIAAKLKDGAKKK